MSEQPQSHHLRVGDRAHRIVASVLNDELGEGRSTRALAITRAARAVFDEHPIEYRPREAFFDAVTAAGVYLNRFAPQSPWRLLGTEVVLGSSRLDVAYELEGYGVLIDELKLGVGRRDEAEVVKQIGRYLEIGKKTWKANFRGVRLCTVHEPMESRFYRSLKESPLRAFDAEMSRKLPLR